MANYESVMKISATQDGELNEEVSSYPTPEMFEPNSKEALEPIRGDFDAWFPDDPASRWILELMIAQNDISITLKILRSFSDIPNSEYLRQTYQLSHYLFFSRMLIAQTYEAWVAFNQKDKIQSPVIRRVIESGEVEKIHQEILSLLSEKFNGGKTLLDLAEKVRLSIFHYFDADAGNWAADLKSMEEDTSLFGISRSQLMLDRRWIVADKFILARFRQAGLGGWDLHRRVMIMADRIIHLIHACVNQYGTRRERPKE